MHNLIILIKSYRPDYNNARILLKSISKFNKDNIPVYLSVNDDDYLFFKQKNIKNIFLLKDSDIVSCNITDPWRYQQVIKSSIHRLNICKNYLCVDSDSEFIKNFYIKDFLYNENLPYTVMHESKFFMETMERIDVDSNSLFFNEATIATRKVLNINDTSKIWDFGPSPYIWSTKVWKEIEIFLAKSDLTLESLLMEISKITSPSENVIYGEFLRINKTIEIISIDPIFKVYHSKEQFDLEKKFHKINKLKKIYLGVIFQSNWKKNSKVSFFKKLFYSF